MVDFQVQLIVAAGEFKRVEFFSGTVLARERRGNHFRRCSGGFVFDDLIHPVECAGGPCAVSLRGIVPFLHRTAARIDADVESAAGSGGGEFNDDADVFADSGVGEPEPVTAFDLEPLRRAGPWGGFLVQKGIVEGEFVERKFRIGEIHIAQSDPVGMTPVVVDCCVDGCAESDDDRRRDCDRRDAVAAYEKNGPFEQRRAFGMGCVSAEEREYFVADFLCGRIAVGGGDGHGFAHDGFQTCGNEIVGRALRGGDDFTPDCFDEQLFEVVPLQRIAERENGIENRSEGVDVGPEAFETVFSGGLFGRHVAGSSLADAVAGASGGVLRKRIVLRLVRCVFFGEGDELGESPVHENHFAVVSELNVFRLEVEMQNSF